jgi:hypothetical protein
MNRDHGSRMTFVASLGALLAVTGCAPLAANEPRPAKSSVGCMRAAIEGRDFSGLSDAQAHCIAAGLIARRCSVTESMLAGVGKEIRDALGAGDAEWRDLTADREGVQCAKSADHDRQVVACCTAF